MKGLLMAIFCVAMVTGKGLPTTTASLATSEAVVQTASCDTPARSTVAISILFEKSNDSIAWVVDETVYRKDDYSSTVSAMWSVTEGMDLHLIIMLPKTTHRDLIHDHVHCMYDFDDDRRFKDATIKEYRVKKLHFRLPANVIDQALLADSSAEIAVKINGKLYVFNSADQEPDSMEMYSQSAEAGTGVVNPGILYIWRKPNRKADEFSLTVFAPIDSALAVNAEKYTCRLKVGHVHDICTPARDPTGQSNAVPTWAIVAAVGGTILLIAIIVAVVVVVYRCRGNRRDPAAVDKDEKKDGEDAQETEIGVLMAGQEGVERDADLQQDIPTMGVQVSNGDEAVPIDGAEV